MERRSPAFEGFRILFRQPALGAAEVAWRWSFMATAVALLGFACREYLATLPVTASERFLLGTGQPVLILQTLARIFQGSLGRALAALIVVSLASTLVWIVLAALGRCLTLRSLFEQFDEGTLPAWRMGSLAALNFLRAGAAMAALVGCVAAFLLASAAFAGEDPSPGSALLLFWLLTALVGMAWTTLNWFLSLAAVFVVGRGVDIFHAFGATVDFCGDHYGRLTAAGAWFGLAHITAFVIASSAAAFPLAFAGVLPAGAVLGGVLLVTLLYFAMVDFLYIGRLAAYVCMVSEEGGGAQRPRYDAQSASKGSRSDDDILSDRPGLFPPPEVMES